MNNEKIKEQVAEGNGAQLENENIPEYKKRFRAKDHTPEGEWVFEIFSDVSYRILGPIEEGRMRQLIATVWGPKTCEENAKRIVECVNAMQGIANPKEFVDNTLNGVWKKQRDKAFNEITQLRGQLNRRTKQCNELLSALEDIKFFVDDDFPPNVELGQRSDEYTAAWEKMNAVIAKIKGGQS